jgi:hypothetical protein
METRIKDASVNGFHEHSASSTEATLLLNLGKTSQKLVLFPLLALQKPL